MKNITTRTVQTVTCFMALALIITGCATNTPTTEQTPTPTHTVTTAPIRFTDQTLTDNTLAHAWLQDFLDNTTTTGTSQVTSVIEGTTGELTQKPFAQDDTVGIVHVYSPAGALWALNQLEPQATSNTIITHATNGATVQLFTVGDILIELHTDTQEKAVTLKNAIEKTLLEYQCKDLTVEQKDFVRNQWVSGEKYTGLTETTRVNSTVNTAQAPKFHILPISDTREPVDKPEAPLPVNIPQNLPVSTIQKPDTNTDIIEQFVPWVNVSYQIPDITGPGCGWQWAEFNNHEPNDLGYQKEQKLKQAQQTIDEKATEYVSKSITEANAQATLASRITEWNTHVEQVNATYDAWEKLTVERNRIHDAWEKYVTEYNYAVDFSTLQEEANEAYKEAVSVCNARVEALNDWNRKYTGSQEGQPGVPPKPTTCAKEPERPSILDDEQPPVPEDFIVPDNVTIPESWTQKTTTNPED